MNQWLWVLVGIMALTIAALIVKIELMRKSAKEIETAFADRLMTETNTLIDVSGNDRYIKSLAASINVELKKLRSQRHKFCQGDKELKNAVTNISHDLRTPLTAICGYLELLRQEEKSEKAAVYLSHIENRIENLKQLTEELFRYTVILATENLEKETVDVKGVLEECLLGFYGAMDARGLTPEITITDKQVTGWLNRSALVRIFNNILTNALKYSDGDLKVCLDDNGRISFSNKALGMDEIQLGRLFDRFFTVETTREGTGLGLSIAKTLVEQMDGTIGAEYKGQTLCIHLEFPQGIVVRGKS
ncbi:MAG: HAMP domain-containing histidine kinase [Clostridium sp.]|nr:HAMP domain-containing histidine kinase [Clostridium sp.]MCM1398352.1 HAMP domain-containing histidine kinase [Clostridium sp.]MCM1458983.1 HAMP domain-containing histidine kinase [Bacteroides sp.]